MHYLGQCLKRAIIVQTLKLQLSLWRPWAWSPCRLSSQVAWDSWERLHWRNLRKLPTSFPLGIQHRECRPDPRLLFCSRYRNRNLSSSELLLYLQVYCKRPHTRHWSSSKSVLCIINSTYDKPEHAQFLSRQGKPLLNKKNDRNKKHRGRAWIVRCACEAGTEPRFQT